MVQGGETPAMAMSLQFPFVKSSGSSLSLPHLLGVIGRTQIGVYVSKCLQRCYHKGGVPSYAS